VNSKKAIIAWIFSAIVGIGMLALPTRAFAHDWDQDDDGWHNSWYNHQGEDEEEDEQENEDYQRPAYGYRYHQEPDSDDYYQPGYGSNWNQSLNGWANPRHPAWSGPATHKAIIAGGRSATVIALRSTD